MIRSSLVDDALAPRLQLSKATLSAAISEADIKRKGGRTKKNKRLIMMPGLISPVPDQEMGVLDGIDGANPTLTMTFPEGRLRFNGRVIHPRQRYLHVSLEKKEAVLKDTFDSMIVFDECRWIGTPEENPEDCALDFPDSVKSWKRESPSEDPRFGSLYIYIYIYICIRNPQGIVA
jgi:hypothetical protein